MLTSKELLALDHIQEVRGSIPKDLSLKFFTDTRTYCGENVFIAIEGANYNPIQFLESIDPSVIIVCENNNYNLMLIKDSIRRFVLVDSVQDFLFCLGNSIAKKFKLSGGRIIAVGGSNGKTTTKEMLYHTLKELNQPVVCTQKNNNNHIGVPLSLFQVSEHIKFCILELGSNHPGEIAYLVKMIEPCAGYVTNIGETHLEFFENLENVFKEEAYLLDYLFKNQKLPFVNLSDEFICRFQGMGGVEIGKEASKDYSFILRGDNCLLMHEGKSFELQSSLITGTHNYYNLFAAISMIHHLTQIELSEIVKAASSFQPGINRSQWLTINNTQIFLDAYNANPSSMRASIKGFIQKCHLEKIDEGELAIILGDMNELGLESERFHRELGRFCLDLKLKNLYFVGKFARYYNEGANLTGSEFLSQEGLKLKVPELLSLHRAVFIKGSRSLQLEQLLDIN